MKHKYIEDILSSKGRRKSFSARQLSLRPENQHAFLREKKINRSCVGEF